MTSRMAKPIPLDTAAIQKLAGRILRHVFSGEAQTDPQSLGPAWQGVEALRQSPDAWDLPLGRLKGLKPKSLVAGGFSTLNVLGEPVKVAVFVSWAPASSSFRTFVNGGSVEASHASEQSRRGKPVRLNVRLNSKRSVNAYLQDLPRFQKELVSVLRHEATHLADLIPYAEDYGQTEDYYNAPSEVRAFMRQTVDEVLEEMRADAEETEGWIDTSWDSAERYLEASPTWGRIKNRLDPKNKKLVLKSVAQGMQAAYPKLRERYYVPWGGEETASKLASRFLAAKGETR